MIIGGLILCTLVRYIYFIIYTCAGKFEVLSYITTDFIVLVLVNSTFDRL